VTQVLQVLQVLHQVLQALQHPLRPPPPAEALLHAYTYMQQMRTNERHRRLLVYAALRY
jgi:hypothetical protein